MKEENKEFVTTINLKLQSKSKNESYEKFINSGKQAFIDLETGVKYDTIQELQEQIIREYIQKVDAYLKERLTQMGYIFNSPEEFADKHTLTKQTDPKTFVDTYFVDGVMIGSVEPIIKPYPIVV